MNARFVEIALYQRKARTATITTSVTPCATRNESVAAAAPAATTAEPTSDDAPNWMVQGSVR